MKAFASHRWTAALFTGLLVVGLGAIGRAEAGEVVTGNPTCAGFDHSVKFENPSGTYGIDQDGLDMTLTVGTYPDAAEPNPDNAVTSYAVSAASEVTTGQIIVKGSDGAIIYQFGEAVPLHSPALENGKWPTISHVQICWDEPEPQPEHGRIELTKAVTGDDAPTTTEFELCITGPTPSTDQQCQTIGAGDTATFDTLEPGTYTVTETDPGTNWTVDYADETILVTADQTATSTVTNTYATQQQLPPVAPTTPTIAPSGGTVTPTTPTTPTPQPASGALPVTGPSTDVLLGQASIAAALVAIGATLVRLGRRPDHLTG